MNNKEIGLLIGGIVSLFTLAIFLWLIIKNHQERKHNALDKVKKNEHKFAIRFFRKWLITFMVFAASLSTLFCWFMFFVETFK